MEHCDNAQRETLLQRILPEISTAAFDMYGTQSLQKIMPLLSDQQVSQNFGICFIFQILRIRKITSTDLEIVN